MGGPGGCLPVHAKLGVGGAAELRVAVGRDIGELAADGAVVNDGEDVRNSALVVRRRQLTRVELLVASQELHDGYQQGEGADVNAPGRGGSGKGELRRSGAYEGGRGFFFLRYQNR